MAMVRGWWLAGLIVLCFAVYHVCETLIPERVKKLLPWVLTGMAVFIVGTVLSNHWLPLGPEKGIVINIIFVASIDARLLNP